MTDDFIAQAQALKDENKRLREALAITSEALGKVKEIVDALLNPHHAQPSQILPSDFIDHSNTSPPPPVVEQPQTEPQYTVTKHGGDDEPHSGPYKVDVSGYFKEG